MNRAEKTAVVDELNQAFAKTPHLVLTSFSGLTVNHATELRTRIRSAGGSYRVIKNRLARLAARGTSAEMLIDQFSGPCAVAYHESDPVILAKTLSEFVKDHPQIELRAGIVDAQALVDAQGLKQLAALPGLDQLRAQLLALILTPATTLVRLVSTPGSQLARVVDARREAIEDSAEG